MKIKLSNNDVSKRNIYELRKRLKSFLEKPGSKLIQDYEELLNSIKHKDDFEVINVIVDGGSLENK